eukprot:1025936-Rhodomonas_salina.1
MEWEKAKQQEENVMLRGKLRKSEEKLLARDEEIEDLKEALSTRRLPPAQGVDQATEALVAGVDQATEALVEAVDQATEAERRTSLRHQVGPSHHCRNRVVKAEGCGALQEAQVDTITEEEEQRQRQIEQEREQLQASLEKEREQLQESLEKSQEVRRPRVQCTQRLGLFVLTILCVQVLRQQRSEDERKQQEVERERDQLNESLKQQQHSWERQSHEFESLKQDVETTKKSYKELQSMVKEKTEWEKKERLQASSRMKRLYQCNQLLQSHAEDETERRRACQLRLESLENMSASLAVAGIWCCSWRV